ncbi:Replicative DNA helicase [Metamycoplasma alkalescens 14918]|uniref:Replicative DNA helicase n=1 Tax=Metamycoplasma alkalescens 14918 TaxID=1188234 RepID=N9SQH8_9BACT|nr:replicative DNA helicase [Metamycoplasma alkalescens]ENY53715.1 Replicative DNA helicase [Metamycoplasma alkalescens 14918]
MDKRSLSSKEIAIANNEASLLGLLLISPEAYLKIGVIIRPEMFHFPSHQILYNAIAEVNNNSKQFDISNLVVYLEENKQFDAIASFMMSPAEYLGYLSENAGFISEIEIYAKNIIDQYKIDRLDELVKEVEDTIKNKVFNISDLLSHIQLSLINIDISEINSTYEKIGDTANTILQQILKKEENDIGVGLKLGFPELDEVLLGLNKGDLMILAARPAMGKTAFALNIATNVAKRGKTVLFFSLEMSNPQLVQRMMAIDSSISIARLKIKDLDIEDQRNLIHTVEDMSTWNIFINDKATLTISDISTLSKRFARNAKVDLVIIDYLQLIGDASKRSQENRQLEVAKISRSLKQLGRELECPIIALSQLSRNVEKREDKTPLISDLRESGAIEQDADRVVFLHRDDYYKNKKNNEQAQNNENDQEKVQASLTNVIVAKNRHGATKTIQLLFVPEYNRFIYDKVAKDKIKTQLDSH